MNKLAALAIVSTLTVFTAAVSLADEAPAPSVKTATSYPVSAPAAPVTPPAPSAPAAPAAPPATAAPATTAQPATAAPEESLKIGYIDMAKVAAESKPGKSATAAMKAKSAKLRGTIEARQKQLEKQKAAIEAKIETMTAKERAEKGKEFQKKVEEYQKLVRSSEEEMQKMQEKLTLELSRNIKKTASSYAKSHGYVAIIEEKAVLYMSEKIEPKDLTDEIAQLLTEKAK